ncbi:LOW QUALITY PROTEIN: Reverse transcriptase [Phytophthora palmivora]|uniref:Reverse transcriptase n=1 Tax=Phytophthora palmivora TaxID=4796 RepID=A0A2P4XW25_9STRA|nr:LOW QUALITY PROTEIN: Reverse transcriptase [Phytophthora palmivora]
MLEEPVSTALQRREGEIVTAERDRQDLTTLIRLDKLLRLKLLDAVVHVVGDVKDLTAEEAKTCPKIASEYDVDEGGLLLICPRRAGRDVGRDGIVQLVVPDLPQQDFLHYHHSRKESKHQKDVPENQITFSLRFIGKCTDVRLVKDVLPYRENPPGNIPMYVPIPSDLEERYPVVATVVQRNTELLIWADVILEYVIAKASLSTEAQTIAEKYEERVFRRFGASEDWGACGERLVFVLNTAQDTTRGDNSFRLIHGWDPKSTLEARVPLGSTRSHDLEPHRRRHQVQKQNHLARELVNQTLIDLGLSNITNTFDHVVSKKGHKCGYTWIE